MRMPPASHIGFTALLLALGAAAGMLFARLGTPLPYMLGSLVASAIVVAVAQHRFPTSYEYPARFRMLFVGVIGAMIGARLTPDVAGLIPDLAVSLPAVVAFVLGAHALNVVILTRLGGYDRPTAYYAGSPGGLFESIIFGEEAGADVRILTLMQFLRIIVVVTLVPVGMSLWEGHPVGSAAGMSMTASAGNWSDPWSDLWPDIALVFGIGLIGYWIGSKLRLPAAQLMGPLLVAGLLSVSGVATLSAPGWLVAVAQVVLGTGLGIRFIGMTRRMFLRGIGLSLVSVGAMMALGVALAAIVHSATGLPTDMLVISFAPGGVVEMSLIALSLAANPAVVTLHHLVRIFFTVVEMSFVRRRGWI